MLVTTNLKWKSDKELRQIIKRMKEEIRPLKKNFDMARTRYWNSKYKLEGKRRERMAVMVVRGERKGKECPAFETRESYRGFHCLARKGWNAYGRNVEFVYARCCSTCRLSHDEARTKAALNKIGVR